ncbi:MAG: hypothetical protein JWM19_424 [Actinomycetia bacterium]|nr:hypothetical protein [Actinomycetes bacterium]
MRRSISAIMLALAIGILSISIPVASAATSARLSAAPRSPGKFGVRLVDVPVSEAGNPRALDYIIDYLPTGTVIHRRILISNDEPQTSRFSIYPAAAHITGGQFTGYSGAARNELTTWVSVRHPVVTLAPGASVMDMVTIKVPRGATRGEHYGVIWVQQRARTRTGTKFTVIEVSRVGIRMYVAVGRGGAPPTSFDITSITGRWSPTGQPIIVAHVNNTGGRALDLNGTASLADGPGNTSSGPFHAQKIVTLAPGQSGNVTFAAPRNLPQGFWRATVTLVSGLTTARATTTILLAERVAAQAGMSYTQRIGLGFGGLVLVVVMGWYALRRRRVLA